MLIKIIFWFIQINHQIFSNDIKLYMSLKITNVYFILKKINTKDYLYQKINIVVYINNCDNLTITKNNFDIRNYK